MEEPNPGHIHRHWLNLCALPVIHHRAQADMNSAAQNQCAVLLQLQRVTGLAVWLSW